MLESSTRAPFRHSTASVILDLVRGLAAVLVLLSHINVLLFLSPARAAPLVAHPRLLKFFSPVFYAGPEAVVVFFVLSGYLISGSVLRWMRDDTWSWHRYLTHRLVRLWLVLLPALLLCAAWDIARVGVGAAADHHLASGVMSTQLAANGVTWGNFFANVFFLQTVHTPVFGSDHPLWSLSEEFWFYILFPLCLLTFRRGTPGRHRLLYGSLLLLVAFGIGHAVLALFPIWLLGSALAVLPPPRLGTAARWLTAMLYTVLFFWIVGHEWTARILKLGYVLGLLTALFLWLMLSARHATQEGAPAAVLSRKLASFSYSLYLLHYPPLVFLAAHRRAPWLPDARHLFLVLLLAIVLMLYAYGVASFTEFRNDAVRQAVERNQRWWRWVPAGPALRGNR